MTANAVANYLKKKILLVTVSVMIERDLTKVLCWLLLYTFMYYTSKIIKY